MTIRPHILIDAHSHVVPRSFPDAPISARDVRWPCMRCTGSAQATIEFGGQPFRALDDRSWNVERRIDDMDRDGIDIQILSPMPELLSYWLEVEHAIVLLDHLNHDIAAMVAEAPSRFRGLAAVPLQCPDRAAEMLPRLRERFGLHGVEIGSNVNGMLLGDERMLPFFAAAEACDLPIFVHALHPIATQSTPFGATFNTLVGFPLDVAMAAASLIMGGVLDRFPRLRIGFSHGGGAIGAILGRITRGLGKPVQGHMGSVEQFKHFFFDSNVYDPGYLAYLAETVAPGQIFLGTDYPYKIMQENPRDFLQSAGMGAESLADVSYRTALRFLGEHNPHE